MAFKNHNESRLENLTVYIPGSVSGLLFFMVFSGCMVFWCFSTRVEVGTLEEIRFPGKCCLGCLYTSWLLQNRSKSSPKNHQQMTSLLPRITKEKKERGWVSPGMCLCEHFG